ncbi:MAG: TenA family transcriptional regulator [Chloroflexota bacterium]|nr:TenA family transcriptional regulator [Chloroflexota bacterium]
MTSALPELAAASLLDRFASEWQAATHHAFLDAVADGSLPIQRFNAWLAQDYLFVADLLAFQAGLLARAPRAAQAVLAGGLVALEDELSWFEAHAAKRHLGLGVVREATTARYQALLEGLGTAPYAAAITGLWAIERAYLDAWRGTLPGGPTYRDFVEHWTTSAFGEYVAGLERAADLALRSSDVDACERASTAFVEVALVEHAFWAMAWAERST